MCAFPLHTILPAVWTPPSRATVLPSNVCRCPTHAAGSPAALAHLAGIASSRARTPGRLHGEGGHKLALHKVR
eukprot:scaffold62843_cov62-Phaeocystis_antarctica.AAC.6